MIEWLAPRHDDVPMASTAAPPPPPRHVRRRSPESQAQFKQQLLQYAKELFRDKGYQAVSIRTITEAFAMSPMSFYSYFASKQDLLKEIWTDFFRELLDALLAAGRGKRSPAQLIEAHADAYLAYWEAHPDRYKLIYLSDLGAVGGELVRINDDPVLRQISMLTRERVLANAQGRVLSEKALRMVQDRMFVRALGYLHATLAVERYPFVDRARLRRTVVQDIVALARQAGDTPG